MKIENVNFIEKPVNVNPVWKQIIIESNIPESLSPLRDLSKNLWWVWNTEASELFKYIDEKIWEDCAQNPVVLLDEVSFSRYKELERDEVFILKMQHVYKQFNDYLEERKNLDGPQIAYFSMEYGLHDSLKIFSGGLGILAGDYLKEASDSKINLVAVGLLYRYGYFKQTINLYGEQIVNHESQHLSKIPVTPLFDNKGNWLEIEVECPGCNIKARVWEVNVGSIKLYLLNTDYPENQEQNRSITHHLYGGNNENRLKQEILLGLGGIKALNKLGYNSDIYHCNEGHAAFIGIERIINLVSNEGLTFAEAKEAVRASTVFTTHTPVPAGHDSFHKDIFRYYMNSIPEKMGLEWDEFEMLGKAYQHEDHFNMSYLACNLSQGINGVSKLHGRVSKTVLKELYQGFLEEELEIGYVTNGVHYSTWAAKEWKNIHKEYFGESFPLNQLNFNVWKNIYKVPDKDIWQLRNDLRLKLIKYVKQRFSDTWTQRYEDPKMIAEIIGNLNPNALTIGFARRFATYKRGNILFRDLNRLAKIVNNSEKPIQFIFAGKAHPADKAGQDLIKNIVEISKRPEFRGKIIFVENYDMNLAQMLLWGVDVWLNTPTRMLEASGTSGEKGIMNGTLHFSVLDGWWVEGYQKDAGWALPIERTYDNDLQDEQDAETIYSIFENEIIEAFYDRNRQDIPERWVGFIKNTIAEVAPNFTTGRMIKDYQNRYYNPQFERSKNIQKDNFALAKEIASWKLRVSSQWNAIEIKSIDMPGEITNKMQTGQEYPVTVKIDLKSLSSEDVGLELVIAETEGNNSFKIIETTEFNQIENDGQIITYKLNFSPNNPGSLNYGFRLFPKNENLPHRQDFVCVRWL